MEELSRYEWLVGNDILHWVRGLLERSGWTFRYEDGRIYSQYKPGGLETPWYHVKSHYALQCGLWHQIMFDLVGKGPQSPIGAFVPSKCQQCWKVVVRPKTLKQLYALLEIQKRMNVPSKCGIERRETVFGLYGGYFYTTSVQEGIERYKQVRQSVDEDKHLGKDVNVLLKRGCTEFEHACGDSLSWEVTEGQKHVEGLIKRWLVYEDMTLTQPEKQQLHTERMWIEYAYKHGDETYKEFTGGKPLHPPYRTYHQLIEHGVEPDEQGRIEISEENTGWSH